MPSENRLKKLQGFLKELGLTSSEITIYLTIVRLGPSSILQITQACHMTRMSVHTIVEKLLKQGLLLETKEPKKRFIFANSWEAIHSLINKKKQEVNLLASEAESLQGFFSTLTTNSAKTLVRHYEGVEGMIVMLKEVVEDAADMYVLSDNENFTRLVDKKLIQNSYKKRAQAGIKTYMLFPEKFTNIWQDKKNYDIQIKTISSQIVSNGGINIRGTKIAFHRYSDGLHSTVIMDDPMIAATMKYLFHLLRMRAKECRG